MYTVYLVGQITADPITYGWRDAVDKYFEHNDNVDIINPCNSLFNQSALRNNDGDHNGYSKTAFKEKGIVLLPHKDREYVKRSNVAFVNMNMYTPEKPILGSFFELAWYFDAPEKMVIGIFEGDHTKDFQCMHPFVNETIQTWVDCPLDACRLLERFMDI